MNHQSVSRNRLLLSLIVVGLVLLTWYLAQTFSGELPVDPVALSLGPLHVRWYGLLIAGAILAGIPWLLVRAKQRGLHPQQADAVAWWSVLGGIVGARLVYVLQNLDVFSVQPWSVLAIQDGGLSIHGALVGGAIVAALAAHRYKIEFWKLSDAAAPPILAGMILGRLGNFFNAELFGPPTSVAWKMFVPVGSRPLELLESAFYHPTFLYDALLNGLVLVLLLKTQKTTIFAGELFLRLIAGIALTRFIVEFWRLGETAALGLSSAQLVSILLFGITVMLILIRRRQAAHQS